jgi:acyl-CoA reductase-like NAD-dependent aldehyde dehydrogenase
MPKSRNRKNHRKAVAAFKKRIDDKKKAFEKQMRAMYERQQQEALEKQIASGEVETQELEGLNVDDFKLETEQVELPQPGIVEGVTTPEQL